MNTAPENMSTFQERTNAQIVTQVHFQPLKPSIQCGHTSKVHSLFKDLVFPGPNHCAHSFSDQLFLVHTTIPPTP